MKINEINDNALGINKLGINKVQNAKKERSTSTPHIKKDSIDLASRNSNYKEIYTKVIDIINKTPDIRMEKVMAIKKDLNSLKDMSSKKLTAVASKILTDLTHIS